MMLPHYTSTKDMSNRQLENLIQECQIELMERRHAMYEIEISQGISVLECTPDQREDYLEWLRGAGNHHPMSQKLLEEWEDDCAQEDIKQSMRGDH